MLKNISATECVGERRILNQWNQRRNIGLFKLCFKVIVLIASLATWILESVISNALSAERVYFAPVSLFNHSVDDVFCPFNHSFNHLLIMSLLAGNASAVAEKAVGELERVIPGINATRYLSGWVLTLLSSWFRWSILILFSCWSYRTPLWSFASFIHRSIKFFEI